jgi:hypothetical protein
MTVTVTVTPSPDNSASPWHWPRADAPATPWARFCRMAGELPPRRPTLISDLALRSCSRILPSDLALSRDGGTVGRMPRSQRKPFGDPGGLPPGA